MKGCSIAYKKGMRGQLRDNSYIKITFGNTNIEAAEDGQWESGNSAAFSNTATLDTEYYTYNETVATLELNRWILDGGSIILPEDDSDILDGYVSDSMTDETGHFETNPILRRDFKDRHSIQGLTISFDTRLQEWPMEFTVRFYLGGNIVNFSDVVLSEPQPKIRSYASEIDRIEIEFIKLLPYRRARLESVLFGFEESFTNDDIESTLQSTDVDPLSRRLPAERFTFSIFDFQHRYDPDNPQGEYVYIEENSPIYVEYGYALPNGSIEWLKPDRYLLDGKPTVQNNVATFNATGMIGRMSDIFYKSKIGLKSFYDMAEEVLQDAGLKPAVRGRKPWEIHNSLKNMYTTAVLPIDTHMNCLQLIAHACRCKLYTDDDNVVHIEPFSVTVAGRYSGEYEDNGHLWFSEWNTVEESKEYNSTYATLELNRWELGGYSQIVPNEDFEVGRGYVSDVIADASGSFTEFNPFWDSHFSIDENGHLILQDVDGENNEFSIDEDGHLIYSGRFSEALRREDDDHVYAESTEQTPPSFEKTFESPHNLHIIGLKFIGPDYDAPKIIQVDYYHEDILIDILVVDNIEEGEVIVRNPTATNCTKFVVTFLEGFPYSRARITNIYYREDDFTINFDGVYHNGESVTKIEKLRAVSVSKYSYVTEMTGGGSGLENVDEVEF